MKITVFGANGKVGSIVVSELTSRGHAVTAFVHGEPHERLKGVTYVQGDIYKYDDVSGAVQGSEAVISCLGSWGTPKKDILTSGMKNILPAMKSAGVTRIVSLTGADALADMDTPSLLQKIMHTVFGVIAGDILRDGEQHIRLLAWSHLAWTVVRSPVMNEKGTEAYQLDDTYPLPIRTIHRKAVARALCDQLEQHNHLHQAPFIGRK